MTGLQPGLTARLGPIGIAAVATLVLILFGVGAVIVPWLTDGGGTPTAASAAPAPAQPVVAGPTGTAETPIATPPATVAPPATSAPATTPVTAAFNQAYEDRVVQLINGERRKARCEGLRAQGQLRNAARVHSADEAAHDFTRPEGTDGSTPEQRVRKAGYGAFADELVAKGGDPGDVVKHWLHDDSARQVLLDCATKSIGVGAAMRGRTPFWTVDTGRA